jgi:glutathione S-transferase
MLLYDSPVSGNCYKVRWLLTRLGIAFERRELDVVDRSNRQEVLGDLNPALRVPTVVFDDGRVLAESGAILWFLAGLHDSGSELVPQAPFERAHVLQWLFFEQYDVEPNIAVARFWRLHGIERPAEELAAKLAGGHRALGALEAHLGARRDFLVEDRFTIADFALYAYTHVAPEGGFDLGGYPAVRAWQARVAAQPGHIPITA